MRTKDRLCWRHVPGLDPPFAAVYSVLPSRVERQARDAFARRRTGQGERRGEAARGHVPERYGRVAIG